MRRQVSDPRSRYFVSGMELPLDNHDRKRCFSRPCLCLHVKVQPCRASSLNGCMEKAAQMIAMTELLRTACSLVGSVHRRYVARRNTREEQLQLFLLHGRFDSGYRCPVVCRRHVIVAVPALGLHKKDVKRAPSRIGAADRPFFGGFVQMETSLWRRLQVALSSVVQRALAVTVLNIKPRVIGHQHP